MSRNQASAKRADRAALELARVLSDGNWYRTSYLAMAAGKYVRPELAWRRAKGSTILEGQREYINARLRQWERFGRVEKRRNGNFVEWRLTKTEWVNDYVVELDRRRAATRQESSRDVVVLLTGTGMRIICPNCQHSFTVRSNSGRKPLDIPFINICEALQHCPDVRAAANSLGCSVGYIYKMLGQRGKKPRDMQRFHSN